MPISMKSALKSANKSRPKFAPGTYEVELIDMKENDGHHGLFFIMEFKIVDGDGKSAPGTIGDWAICPDNARAAGKMTVAMARQKDQGKIQKAVAAVYGYSDDQQDRIDDEIYQESIKRPVSPMKGARFIVQAIAHRVTQGERAGQMTTFYEFLPKPDGNGVGAAKAAPKAPVKAKPTFEEAALAAGWEPHPESDAHYYDVNDTVIETVDLKKQLGYAG